MSFYNYSRNFSLLLVLLYSYTSLPRADICILAMTCRLCYHIYNNQEVQKRKGVMMYIEIDFNSEEAIYIQLRNQIIMGIATSEIREGESLPSVRQLAERVGINMHTVNKAYSVLKQEGYIQLDRRKGAVIALDMNKLEAIEKMRAQLRIVLARGLCKNISREEAHELVDEIFDEYMGG